MFKINPELCVRKIWSVEKQAVKKLLAEIDDLKKCAGVAGLKFQDMNCPSAYRYVSTSLSPGGKPSASSLLRSNLCQGWSNGQGRCAECDKLLVRLEKKLADTISSSRVHRNTPLTSMTKQSLVNELKNTRKDVLNLEHLRKELETRSVLVSKDMSDGLSAIIGGASIPGHVQNRDLLELFWKEQRKAFGTDPRGMRWHPTMIRLAIYLHFQSPRAYEAFRSTGIIRLPNKSTLRDYTNVVSPNPGFQLPAFEENVVDK